MSKRTEWADGLSLSTGGRKLVGKAGIVPVRRLADKVGLTDFLGGALVRRAALMLTKFPRPTIRSPLTGHSTTRSSANNSPTPTQSLACMRSHNP